MVYPHPYFGCKILVFLSLRTGLRCKIVKTKEFPAKSSRIRSYVAFRPLLAASGLQAACSASHSFTVSQEIGGGVPLLFPQRRPTGTRPEFKVAGCGK